MMGLCFSGLSRDKFETWGFSGCLQILLIESCMNLALKALHSRRGAQGHAGLILGNGVVAIEGLGNVRAHGGD